MGEIIGFAGTDGRTLLGAQIVSAEGKFHGRKMRGAVVRGMSSMPVFANQMEWDIDFVPTYSNRAEDYAGAAIKAMGNKELDYLIPMPEALLFNGIVDMFQGAGRAERIVGLNSKGSLLVEGNKISCRMMCDKYNVPIPGYEVVDARNFEQFRSACLSALACYGGAVAKYPYSAGGKGARMILDAWHIRPVYESLMADYADAYKKRFGAEEKWPILIEQRVAGVEISFTIFVDGQGNFQILPTAMDYPERFPGPASLENPITGGMGAISPHPMESDKLIQMAGEQIARPVIEALRDRNLLRPCILYPGCIVSFNGEMQPVDIKVCEINIRPGEPEVQPVFRRLKNLGELIIAMIEGRLNRVRPLVRDDQLAICLALVTGRGGPDGQKGYPWRVTKGELVEIDYKYLRKKGIQLIPSAMILACGGRFHSDGTRVCFINASAKIKGDRQKAAEKVRKKLLVCYQEGKVRVIPREPRRPNDNRLAIRADVGTHFKEAKELFN